LEHRFAGTGHRQHKQRGDKCHFGRLELLPINQVSD
jgi:hypothetical protein